MLRRINGTVGSHILSFQSEEHMERLLLYKWMAEAPCKSTAFLVSKHGVFFLKWPMSHVPSLSQQAGVNWDSHASPFTTRPLLFTRLIASDTHPQELPRGSFLHYFRSPRGLPRARATPHQYFLSTIARCIFLNITLKKICDSPWLTLTPLSTS